MAFSAGKRNSPKVTLGPTHDIQKIISEEFAKLNAHIDVRFNEMQTSLEHQVNTQLNKIVSDVSDLSERVSVLESLKRSDENLVNIVENLQMQLSRLENNNVACDLRLTGIPHENNEKLDDIFKNICSAAGVPTPVISRCQRVNYLAGRQQTDGPIIVRLQTPAAKKEILREIARYKKSKNDVLRLKDAGFDSERPIYLNENLTKKNHRIFKHAKELKKKNKISSVFTLRGLVHIKITPEDAPMVMETFEQINNFFRV